MIEPSVEEFACTCFLLGRSQVELGASGLQAGWGGASPRQSHDIFLGTVLTASGQAALPKSKDICEGGLGFVLVPLESFLPGPKAVG